MQRTKFTAFFATAMVGLTAAQVCAQQTWFGDESAIEVESWDREGLYASISGLLVLPDDSDISSSDDELNALLQAVEATIEYDSSVGVSGAIGYEFSNHIRGEVQYSYMDIEMDSFATAVGNFSVTGNPSVQTLMLNAYYDFPFTVQIEPYVGLGVGVAYHSFVLNSLDGEPTDAPRENDTTLAYQAMAGVGYKVNARTTLSTGVRYVVTDDPDFGELSSEFSAFVFEFGIRFGF